MQFKSLPTYNVFYIYIKINYYGSTFFCEDLIKYTNFGVFIINLDKTRNGINNFIDEWNKDVTTQICLCWANNRTAFYRFASLLV